MAPSARALDRPARSSARALVCLALSSASRSRALASVHRWRRRWRAMARGRRRQNGAIDSDMTTAIATRLMNGALRRQPAMHRAAARHACTTRYDPTATTILVTRPRYNVCARLVMTLLLCTLPRYERPLIVWNSLSVPSFLTFPGAHSSAWVARLVTRAGSARYMGSLVTRAASLRGSFVACTLVTTTDA